MNDTEFGTPGVDVDPEILLMTSITEVIYKWWPFFTATIGICGNTMSLLITTQRDNRRHSTCVYMAGLAIVDTCFEFVVSAYKILVFHFVGENMHENLAFLRFVITIPLKCNLLRQIWIHPFDILHSSVTVTTLGSLEQLISTQNFMQHGILGTICFFD